jgi:ABC-type transport system substrate-binding protein
LIPPGIPGHTPDLRWRFDVQAARHLLVEAGYPDGKGLPPIKGITRLSLREIASEISLQWQQNPGIEVSFEAKSANEMVDTSQPWFSGT